ncbi:restriction endonuclease subunit S [Paenibacillus dendritiformis]|uniref:restriction endonuclease subunit S n=1 Tax=Paenibacillus dendritiformis TaxID=130049 RepID=UPI001B1CD3CB|nr:restriction endonuclease subunit S [Paenibacillus dendritiformis]GIO72113.1 restriction endonuclease subunit S [Paenibacillus dendritiformis]
MNRPVMRFKEFKGDWKKYSLNDFAAKITKKNTNFEIKNVISNSSQYGLVSQREYFDKDIANADNIDNYYVIDDGDFVYNPRISKESPYGPVNIYKYPEPGVVSPLYLCFRVEEISKTFLSYFFKTSNWYRHIYLNGDSGARHDRVSIKDSDFLNMEVHLPSLQEQEKVSSFLILFDQKIEKQQEKIEQLELFKKGIIQKIFSQEIRFKDANGQDFPKWEQKTLGELGQFRKGGTLSKSDISETGEACILYGELYTRYTSIIDEVYSKTKVSDNKVYGNANDVLIPSSGESAIDIAQASALLVENVLLGGDLNVFTPYKGVSGAFLSYQINSIKRKELAKLAQGASVVHLYSESLKKLTVWLPDYKEQLKIASFLSLFDKKIIHEKKKLLSQNERKKGFLQEMFV